jgi:hypothetical protein
LAKAAESVVDPRLKRRIFYFYFAGVVNLALGLYVLIYGRSFLPQGTVMILVLFFFGFAAVDFYFPQAMKKKWADYQKQLEQEQQRKQSGQA